jgi:hypothetical protein
MTTASPDVVHQLWRGEDPRLDGAHLREAAGEWAFDGTSEYDEVRSSGMPLGMATGVAGAGPWDFVRSDITHAIFDTNLWARIGESGPFLVGKSGRLDPADPAQTGFGPFRWSPSDLRLDRYLRSKFSGVAPERRKSVHQGRVMDVEVYNRKEEPPANLDCDISLRCEVQYDCGFGYLPRVVRCTSLWTTETTVEVIEKQLHLIRCRAGPGGGFIPSDYYVVQFQLLDRRSKHPDLTIETAVEPSGLISIGHFRALDVQAQNDPLAMKRPDYYSGKRVSSQEYAQPSDGDFPLTMARIEELVGDKLDKPALVSERSSSFLDRLFGWAAEEAAPKEFAAEPWPDWPLYLLAAPIVGFVVVALARRSRVRYEDDWRSIQ